MSEEVFNEFKSKILSIDPVAFAEKYLTLDGEPFRLHGNGYKPFADIYRYIGAKAVQKNSKPVILVKGRQVGATTMASVIESYFMASGLFGNNGRPPMRLIHCFPNLIHVFTYSKTKLSSLLNTSLMIPDPNKPGKMKPYMLAKLDSTSPANDSQQFKQFEGGNFLRVESTGLAADRLRGGTVDCMLYDECFPYEQNIQIKNGKISIGKLYDMYASGKELPEVLTFNEETENFEYKKILKAWKREPRKLIEIHLEDRKIKCTENHRFLTMNGWKRADNLIYEDQIKSTKKSILVIGILKTNIEDVVYDIEVEDNHNFLCINDDKNGIVAHNCQDIPREALSNANKLLVQSKYGPPGDGIQVYFGTPKQRGSEYFKMWQASSQQYYYLGCEKCNEHFPLYTPGSNEWEKIWIYGFIVKCPHCGHEQDKRQAAERGRWVATQAEEDSKFVGYHINQFYMPNFTREKIDSEKPENHPINTERAYQNEVLGEFYSGVGFLLTPDEIQTKCGDMGRKMKARINPGDKVKVYAGFDWGDKIESEENSNGKGKSYSCCVVLAENQTGILDIEFATILKQNNLDFKKQTVDEVFRRYSVELGVGDIGYANDLSELLQKEHGDKFLVSRSSGNVRNHIKYDGDVFPKTIHFERDYHIAEVIDLLKRGLIRFPYGNFEQISWLITHCCSMEIKTSTDRWGEISTRYVKGATPNDGFMALVNAYLAYKYSISEGFSLNKKSLLDKDKNNKILAITGFVPRMH
jgi:hypothetical protein